jgi:hypothetical protein
MKDETKILQERIVTLENQVRFLASWLYDFSYMQAPMSARQEWDNFKKIK